jgi:glycosyltransferase involved in cell wall biosynthesis
LQRTNQSVLKTMPEPRKRQIYILTPGFPDGGADTSCLPFLCALAKAHSLDANRADIKILSFQYPFHRKPYRYFSWEVMPFGGKNKKGFSKILLWFRILSYMLRQSRPDVVICLWATETALIGNIFRGITGVHCITWMLGQDVLPSNKYLRILNIDHSRYFPISEMSARTLSCTISAENKFNILHMGVDESIHKQFSRATNPGIDILGAGSLTTIKQWNVFLEVCHLVKKKLPEIQIRLLGDGPEKMNLKSLALSFGFSDNILCGEVPNEKVIENMYNARIFLHTSSFEGQSAVITNAVRAGMHVVCFDVGRIEHSERIHVCADEQAMAEKIAVLLLDIHTEYSIQKVMTAEQTLDKLLGICEA